MDVLALLGLGALKSLPPPLPALIALSIVLTSITLLVYLLKSALSFSSSSGSSIVLTGPMGSGKTVLYYRLKIGNVRDTFPSMKENVAEFHPQLTDFNKEFTARFVDFPGHGSQRHKLHGYLSAARLVIFCIDSTDSSSIPIAAKNLHDILSNATIYTKRIPVFLACTKSDSADSRPTSAIVKDIEKEISAIRDSRDAMIEDLETSSSVFSLGSKGVDFNFSQCPSPVSVGAVSAKSGDLDELTKALKRV